MKLRRLLESDRVMILGAFFVLLVLAIWDPNTSAWFPRCILFVTTGLKCPGCGTQRAVHSLCNGDVLQALHHNALAVSVLPFLAYSFAGDLSRRCLGRSLPTRRVRSTWIWNLLGLIVLFAIVRNIASGSF